MYLCCYQKGCSKIIAYHPKQTRHAKYISTTIVLSKTLFVCCAVHVLKKYNSTFASENTWCCCLWCNSKSLFLVSKHKLMVIWSLLKRYMLGDLFLLFFREIQIAAGPICFKRKHHTHATLARIMAQAMLMSLMSQQVRQSY